MGERKVLNKYFPPDFDPAKLPRNKRPKGQQIKVRVMLPFTAQCNTCGNWIGRGTKFNARCERALGEHYLGIKVLRFYIRCGGCHTEIVFKTDPKNHDYVCEAGANRQFEPWRQEQTAAALRRLNAAETQDDPMQQLEDRTQASKKEMDALDALEEVMELNARYANLDTDAILKKHASQYDVEKEVLETKDDWEAAKVAFKKEEKVVKRLEDEDDDDKLTSAGPSLFGAIKALQDKANPSSSAAASSGAPSSSTPEPAAAAPDAPVSTSALASDALAAPSVAVVIKKKKKKKKDKKKKKQKRKADELGDKAADSADAGKDSNKPKAKEKGQKRQKVGLLIGAYSSGDDSS